MRERELVNLRHVVRCERHLLHLVPGVVLLLLLRLGEGGVGARSVDTDGDLKVWKILVVLKGVPLPGHHRDAAGLLLRCCIRSPVLFLSVHAAGHLREGGGRVVSPNAEPALPAGLGHECVVCSVRRHKVAREPLASHAKPGELGRKVAGQAAVVGRA